MLIINGTEYVRAGSREVGEHVCVICTNGWIFEGRINKSAQDMTLTDAHNVRSWSNGRGLGAIAKAEYKNEYELDPVGTIRLNPDAVIGCIALEW